MVGLSTCLLFVGFSWIFYVFVVCWNMFNLYFGYFWIVLPKLRGILSRMGSRVDTEPKALLDPVQEAAPPAAPAEMRRVPPPRTLRPATQSPRGRTGGVDDHGGPAMVVLLRILM